MDAVQQVQQVNRDAGLTIEKAIVHARWPAGGFETGRPAEPPRRA